MRLSRWTTLGSATGMAGAGLLWLGVGWMLPVHLTTSETAAPIGLACAALLPAAGVLALMILLQMTLRAGTGAIDPLAGADTVLLRVNQRVLTNTVEQLAVFTPAMLALAGGASPDKARFIIAAGFVFAVARLAFWAGYLCGPLTRAPGMAATLAVNLLVVAAAIWVWIA